MGIKGSPNRKARGRKKKVGGERKKTFPQYILSSNFFRSLRLHFPVLSRQLISREIKKLRKDSFFTPTLTELRGYYNLP